MSRFAHALVAVLAASAAAGAGAQSVTLTATLTNAQEDRVGIPPTIPTLVGGALRPVSSACDRRRIHRGSATRPTQDKASS